MTSNNVIHIVPHSSIFLSEIQKVSNGEEVYVYSRGPLPVRLISYLKLYIFIARNRGKVFKFHWIPLYELSLIRLIHDGKIIFQYWGGDIYHGIGGETLLQEHCRKGLVSKNLLPPDEKKTSSHAIKYQVKKLFSLWTFGLANEVIMTKKQFRMLTYFYFKTFRNSPRCQRGKTNFYGAQDLPPQEKIFYANTGDDTIVLICHSGTRSVNVSDTMHLLRAHPQSRSMSITGFLSYGGSIEELDLLDDYYKKMFDQDFKSCVFERRFLAMEELDRRLMSITFMFLSCYRDEAFSLVNRYLLLGGLVFFNKRSINYHYFKEKYASQVYSHSDIFKFKISALSNMRRNLSRGL